MNNYLQIAGHSFSVMFFEPRLNDANYLNLPMKRGDFMKRMSHYKDGGKTFDFFPVLTNLTWRGPESIGMKTKYSYEDLTELNYLANLISELDDSELNIYKAILTYAPEFSGNDTGVTRLINLTQNTYKYEYYPYIFGVCDLGKTKMLGAFGEFSMPEELSEMVDLFDFEKMGERFLCQMKGHLFTPGGFFEVLDDEPWETVYTGNPDEIPEEFRLDI